MSIETIRIPQLGEGLQEALLVEYLRQPGDEVKRDEPLYVLETDKATAEVESSFEGRIVEWTAAVGQVLPIGTEIGTMEVKAAVEKPPKSAESSVASTTANTAGKVFRLDSAQSMKSPKSIESRKKSVPQPQYTGAVRVPPRSRRHLKELGLLDRIDEIPRRGTKLMPEDIDRFVAASMTDSGTGVLSPIESPDPAPVAHSQSAGVGFSESALPRRQMTLNYRLQRGLHQVVPATAVIEVNWRGLAEARELNRQQGGPTGFMMMLWCVTRSLVRYPSFRSTLVQDGRVLRTYDHVNLGIAVALPDDSLVTAVVPEADTLQPAEFWQVAARQIQLAKQGQDQADQQVTFTVSNVGTFGLDMGIPVVVPPAVATMGLGRVAPKAVPDGESFKFTPCATLALTFDHRIVNGLGAGQFLANLKEEIDQFSWTQLMGS
jgi:pyruvate/2-oxoglutarate dehydrogenase complex dihydrolipoamide acyltransferase (E2) component